MACSRGVVVAIDLHGLRVRDAWRIVRAHILREAALRATIRTRYVFITGRGLHSEDGVPRIKHCIIRKLAHLKGVLCDKLDIDISSKCGENSGCVVVSCASVDPPAATTPNNNITGASCERARPDFSRPYCLFNTRSRYNANIFPKKI